MKNKVVIKVGHGIFGLSGKALEMLSQLKGEKFWWTHLFLQKYPRHDKDLIKVVSELGIEADGAFCELKIVEFTGNKYLIEEDNGHERVVTPEQIEWVEI